MRRKEYESDNDTFPANAYRVDGHPGIAWYVLGWETELAPREYTDDCPSCDGTGEGTDDDEDETPIICSTCDGSGRYTFVDDDPEPVRTGQVVCVMVGDDRHWTFDPEDVSPLGDDDYCHECGQMGCGHDGRDRSEVTR